MSLKLFTSVILAFMIYGQHIHGHTYHSGECPSVEPMQGFDIKQVS